MKYKTRQNYEKRWFTRTRINPFKYQDSQKFNEENKSNITHSTFLAYKRIWKALKLKDLEKLKEIKIEVKEKDKKILKTPKVKTTILKMKTAKMVKKRELEKKEVVEPKEEIVSKEANLLKKINKRPEIEKNLYFLDKFLIKRKKKQKVVLEIIKIIEPSTQYDENLVSFYLKFYLPIVELYIKEKVPKKIKIDKIIPNYLHRTTEVQGNQNLQVWKIIPELGKNTYNFGYICSGVSDILGISPILKKKLPKTILRLGTINEFEYKIAHICDGNRTIETIAKEMGETKENIVTIIQKLKNLGLITEKLTGDFPFEVLIPEMNVSFSKEDIQEPHQFDIFVPELHQLIQSYKIK